MGATCIDLCKRIKMPNPNKAGGFYKNGYKRCKHCEWWVKPEVLIELGYGTLRCPCCKVIFKTKPNKNKIKVIAHERK